MKIYIKKATRQTTCDLGFGFKKHLQLRYLIL